MSRNERQRAPASAGIPQQANPTTRNNEYFLPRDGIDREVITADICRYLGNDALVRPGHLEKGDRIIQGYYITAYRNLTSAMIESLKEDSQKWVEEKRRVQGAQGGQMRYMDSSVRNPTISPPQHMSGASRDFPDPQAGYSDPYSAGAQGGFAQYPPRDTGYAAPNAFPPREPVYADRQDPYGLPRGNPQQYAPAGYNQPPDGPYHATGMNMAPYASGPGGAQQGYIGDHAQRAAPYPPASQSGPYPPQAAPYYMPHSGAPAPAAAVAYDAQAAQPRDVFHGRASPAGATGYNTAGLDQQYGQDPSRPRASATLTGTSAQTQMPSSGNPAPARRDHNRDHARDHNRDRERDRYSNSARR